MKTGLSRFFRNGVLTALLCCWAMLALAQTAERSWQALMDQHAELTKQGRHEDALAIAKRALKVAEGKLDFAPTNVVASLDAMAASHVALRQFEMALPVQTRALSLREKVSGPDHFANALELLRLAKVYQSLGQYEEALPLQQRALSIVEKLSGSEHPNTATISNNLAVTYIKLARYDEALALQQRALTINERTLGPDHPTMAVSLNNLAEIYSELAQYDKAIPLQLRALSINEKSLGLDHPVTAVSLNNLAETRKALAQYDEALPLHQRALAIRERALGPDHPATAESLNNLAETYRALAMNEKAIPLLLRALSIFERTSGLKHPDTATILNNLALAYSALSQYDKTLPLQLRALAIREKALGPDHPVTAVSLNNVAETYRALAHYDKALPLHQRALTIREKVLGPDHPATAVSLSNLAETYRAVAQSDKALPLQLRALSIREKVLGSDHPDTAESLNNLAATYGALDQYDKELLLQLHALAIREKALGPDHPDTAQSLSNLAETYRALAQYDKALPLQLRALAIREKALGPDHADTAGSLNNLAATYIELAQYEKAIPLQVRAMAIYEETLGPDNPATALATGNWGHTLQKTAQSGLAIAFLKSSVNSYQRIRETVSRIGSSEIRIYTDSVAKTYQYLADLLIDQDRLFEAQMVLDMLKEEEQFDFIRRSAATDPRSTSIGYSPTETVWMDRYRKIADKLAALGAEERVLQLQEKTGLSAEQKLRQQSLRDDLQIARKVLESFLGDMREGFARQGAVRSSEIEEVSQTALREQQAAIKSLGEDVVLLRYYVTEDKVGILLTTPGVSLARSSAINTKELSRQIADFRRLLRDPKSNPLPAAQELYRMLVAPVAADLDQAGAKNIMLSLDGALRYLPFSALHDGQRYLVERWNLPMYTSVTKKRLLDAVAPQWRAAGLGVTRAQGEFAALPAVGAEMSSIVKLAGSGVLPGEVYLDQAFTALRLKDVSQRKFQLLHVASHFRFSPGTEVNSFLLLGDGQQLTLGEIRTQNYRFDNVDLLTLSACDTGLGGGRDAQGQEIEGFGVIAQQQGAKAVLATLWPVADQSTGMLMVNMYRQRQEQHLTKIAALQQAQRALLAQPKYSHPFYWAPFILMGNWK